jgi:anti-sigma B factor antagonist
MSLEISTKKEDSTATVSLTGRLDTVTAPELEKELEALYPEISELVLDMEKSDYVSSAGLRVILKAQKTMSQKGSMVLTHVDDNIMEIFEITGFVDFLTIQ